MMEVREINIILYVDVASGDSVKSMRNYLFMR